MLIYSYGIYECHLITSYFGSLFFPPSNTLFLINKIYLLIENQFLSTIFLGKRKSISKPSHLQDPHFSLISTLLFHFEYIVIYKTLVPHFKNLQLLSLQASSYKCRRGFKSC